MGGKSGAGGNSSSEKIAAGDVRHSAFPQIASERAQQLIRIQNGIGKSERISGVGRNEANIQDEPTESKRFQGKTNRLPPKIAEVYPESRSRDHIKRQNRRFWYTH
jgi:hypothetical protein